MKLQPVWGRLTVLPTSIEETDEVLKSARAAGLELPESQEKERLQHGQVEGTLLAIGGNCFDDWGDPIPKVGDTVVYDKYAGFIKKWDDKDIRVISDTDIIAIIGE